MSRPDRPFRATRVLANRTVHHDYATKEERDAATCTEDKRTTVTSRKPVKPGTPVCWVNVYEDSDGKRAGGFTHRTEGAAALSAGSAAIHCIPVYLPGEGAEPVTEQMREAAVGYYLQHQKDRQRIGELESEVERLKTALTETMAQRDAAQAQAMPAGKVVYGARRANGDGSISTTREFINSKRSRDIDCPASADWKHYTRWEES